MRTRSIRKRLRIALGVIAMLVFTVVGGALYLTLAGEFERSEHAALRTKTEVLRDYVERNGQRLGLSGLQQEIDRVLMMDESGLGVWLLSPASEVLVGTGPLPQMLGESAGVLRMRSPDGTPREGLRVPLATEGAGYDTLVVGLDIRRRVTLLHTYLWLIFVACGSGVLLTMLLADLATRQGLAPIRRISAQAACATPMSLATPVEVGEVDSEIADLVRGLNIAAERVRATYRQMESFNADVAHELRTPVACMISAAQVTLAEPRTPEALREALAEQLEQLEQMKGMINDMLFLARADLGEVAQDARPAQLAEQARSTVEFYEALLAESGVHAVVEGDARVRCNPGLIRRAISNLLSNAIKHTSAGDTIRIGIRRENDDALIEVFNPGAPLPEELRARMFDRFYRADEARCAGGHGLGLSIVRAVAMMHGGEAYALADPQGSRVGIRIPLEPPVQPVAAPQAAMACSDAEAC